MSTVLYKKLNHCISLTKSDTESGAGVDLVRLITTRGVPLTYSSPGPLMLYSNTQPVVVPCGVEITVPSGYVGFIITDHSALKRNIVVPGTPWTTTGSTDETCEIHVPLMNVGSDVARLTPGECVARFVIFEAARGIEGVIENEEYVSAEPIIRTRTVHASNGNGNPRAPIRSPPGSAPTPQYAVLLSPGNEIPLPANVSAEFAERMLRSTGTGTGQSVATPEHQSTPNDCDMITPLDQSLDLGRSMGFEAVRASNANTPGVAAAVVTHSAVKKNRNRTIV